METAVVTFETNTGQSVDLRVPVDVSLETLLPVIAEGLGWSAGGAGEARFQIRAKQADLRVGPHDTLESAGIVTGDTLIVQVSHAGSFPQVPGPALVSENGGVFQLGREVLIGRSNPQKGQFADIDLSEMDINRRCSRQHARVGQIGDRFFLTDVGSSNGTFVNDEPLTPHEEIELHHEDVIEIGRDGVRLQFRHQQ